MKKGKRILILLALAVLIVSAYELRSPKEPTYQGKTVTEWLHAPYPQQQVFGDPLSLKSADALATIGPKAAPYIVRELELNESFWNRHYLIWYVKLAQHRGVWWLVKKLPRPRPQFPYSIGATALVDTGPSVAPQLPAMVQNSSPSVRRAACCAINHYLYQNQIDTLTSVAAFSKGLHDPDEDVREMCANFLFSIGSNGTRAIPDLLATLDSTNNPPKLRNLAIQALCRIEPRSKEALPVFRKLLKDHDPALRVSAAEALWLMDGEVTNTLPVLIDAVDKFDRFDVVNVPRIFGVLGGMGPQAKDAAPVLGAFLQAKPSDTNQNFKKAFWEMNCRKVREILPKIDPDAAAKLAN